MNPGDIVLADKAGIVVIPHASGADVLTRAKQRKANEEAYLAALAAGEFSNAWVDAELEQGGCLFDERPFGTANDDLTTA